MSDRPDYRSTVFLPKTDFPMKAGLPAKEPGILARWEEMGLYRRLREARAGREKFILHDGPPYANGDIHIGHALNKVLKDMVVRTQTLLGKDAPYVPGWDCHGLPIEWKIEEEYRKRKKSKDEVPPAEFRRECRDYAAKWVEVQREQFKRLGVIGDWDNPYLTMAPEAEAVIVAELIRFAESGQLYRGAKPVMWSPVEKTALAEAEIEYEDITSTQIDVGFEIVEAPNCPAIQQAATELRRIAETFKAEYPDLPGRDPFVEVAVWTTTPWTIPVNQAIAYNPEVTYALSWEGGVARAYLVAEALLPEFERRTGIVAGDAPTLISGHELAGAVARHPMHRLGGFYAAPRPFLPGEFVTTDQGTGLVHMAPDHGEDDFELCKAHGIGPVFAVEGDGRYRDDWLWLGGADERRMSVINPKFNAPDGPICSDLRDASALLAASADFKHSYPHSWRSKAKVIFRCTPQWFVPMDRVLTHLPAKTPAERRWENEGGAMDPADEGRCASPTLREAAMQAIADTRFVPEKGRNRIGSMVEGRPDWVLSRQRAWGVPITLFVNRETGQYLVDPEVNARIVAAVGEKGVDAWTDEAAQDFLGSAYASEDYERVSVILYVWFDSGCTLFFTLESGRWPDLQWPASLYLEGSDQHRGWFQSSLLESCGTRGRAPYDAVLTHGFTMDAAGKKMSKSLGNTVDPLKVMEEFGADIIRLWALSVDFTEDHRIGREILQGVADQYRKLRNTFRYLLGALDGFSDAERVTDAREMPELERYVLHLLAEMDAKLKQAVNGFDFNAYVRLITDFANDDLSAFFFDIRKDSLYCDASASPKRRACRTVLDLLFHAMVRWTTPVLVFTTEEVWGTRYPDADTVHLLEWPEIDAGWREDELANRWALIRATRERVTEAIEPLRREKAIGSSLEAKILYPDLALDLTEESLAELAEIYIVSEIVPGQGEGIEVTRTDNLKCGRCWRHLPEVAEDGGLCARCEGVVNG
ncbi:MAG: isoleucine--tRNA ligase [Sphingosinicella sp.]|uniref:isoleucine--tRNA ligase n=1 Tax=Sphingosinicella sp. TaxID=1917971 RepID=UPI0040382942